MQLGSESAPVRTALYGWTMCNLCHEDAASNVRLAAGGLYSLSCAGILVGARGLQGLRQGRCRVVSPSPLRCQHTAPAGSRQHVILPKDPMSCFHSLVLQTVLWSYK
jgi:hypothetical protein